MTVIKKNFSQNIKASLQHFTELTTHEQELMHHAINVRLNAQAPYSKYAVGAAILSNKVTIHTGCNVERCSWTQTTHAEQNAIDTMVAQSGSIKIALIAIVGGPLGTQAIIAPATTQPSVETLTDVAMACGHCRQIIWENCYQDPTVKLISLTAQGYILSTTIGDLLPMAFGPEHLGINYDQEHQKRL